MLFDSLTIKNFRLLEDVKIEKLGYVNLIVGQNNSGKSTVLEALALWASGFRKNDVEKLLQNRTINRHSQYLDNLSFNSLNSFLSKENTDKTVFIGDVDSFYIEFGYAHHFEDIKNHNSEYSLNIDFLTHLPFTVSSNLQLTDEGKQPFGLEVNPFCFYEFIDTTILDLDELCSIWEDIVLTESEDLIKKMLQIIEPNIINFAFITENNKKIPFVRLKGENTRTPLHFMGDGVFRLLQIILKVVKLRDGILLIDEFENGLHYSVQPKVWRLIFELAKRFNIQVFATTHSWDCIESFAQVAKEREDLDGVLFRMGRSARKSDEGKVIATVYDEDELYNITKTKMEVR